MDAVQERDPVLHLHEDSTFSPIFREVEVGRDEAVQLLDVLFIQVVLGDGDVRLLDFPIGAMLPIRERGSSLL